MNGIGKGPPIGTGNKCPIEKVASPPVIPLSSE
jgi:hypothetical protein